VTSVLDQASVRFGDRVALDGVSIPANASEITVVVGGDGAGKSTCLRAIVGLVGLERGEVRRPPKNRIGYLPSSAGLYVDLTVEENLAFFATSYGISRSDLRRTSEGLLDQLGLTGARRRLVGQLSGGMQRKLAVGIALLHHPELLVLDEPTTGVDPVSRADLWRIIAGAAARGAAVVVASTYVNEAALASSVVLLESGRTIASGTPDGILRSVPGAIGSTRDRVHLAHAWRRGREWRVWAPSGQLPDNVRPVEPDFDDAVVVAALADEISERR
jgi:ABC-2 type transport system ATP-binding protein